jgi:hypothetical protein
MLSMMPMEVLRCLPPDGGIENFASFMMESAPHTLLASMIWKSPVLAGNRIV